MLKKFQTGLSVCKLFPEKWKRFEIKILYFMKNPYLCEATTK